MCLMVGFFPDWMTEIAVVLSSLNSTCSFRRNNTSQRKRAGRPSDRTAVSAATSSASGVLCETQVCLLLMPVSGKRLLGPTMQRKMPVVERYDPTSPARSASEYRTTRSWSTGSPM